MRKVSLPAQICPNYNFSSPATVNGEHRADHSASVTRDNSVENDGVNIVKLRQTPRRVSILDRPDYRYFRDNGGGVGAGVRKLSRRFPGIFCPGGVTCVTSLRLRSRRLGGVVFTQL